MNRIKELEDALSDLIDVAADCDGWESFPSDALDKAFHVWEKKRNKKKYNSIEEFYCFSSWVFESVEANDLSFSLFSLTIKSEMLRKSFCGVDLTCCEEKLLKWANGGCDELG